MGNMPSPLRTNSRYGFEESLQVVDMVEPASRRWTGMVATYDTRSAGQKVARTTARCPTSS